MECPVNFDTISNGIKEVVKEIITSSGKFSKNEGVYTPLTEDYQLVVVQANAKYGEEIFMQLNEPEPQFTIIDPSPSLVNSFLPKEAEPNAGSNEQAIFSELQERDIISGESLDIDGIPYYKLEGEKSKDKADRLREIIKARNIDFLHVVEAENAYLVQVGRKEKASISVEDRSALSSKATSITKNKVLGWLERLGFTDVETVRDLIYNGEKLDASAYTDFATATIRIAEGMEDYTLPEEAMTVMLEVLKQGNQPLYSLLKKEVVNYKLYKELINNPDYTITNRKLYSLPDGTLNYDKLKDEAITKLLAEYLINKLEGSGESQRRIETALSLWDQVVAWVRSVFGKYKNPFEEALEEFEDFSEFKDVTSKDIFLSAKSVDQIDGENEQNKDLFNKIRTRATELGVTKVDDGTENAYYKDGNKQPDEARISAKVESYNKKIFGKRNFSEYDQKRYDISREDGTRIHKMIEKILESRIDFKTGLLKRTQDDVDYPVDTPADERILERLDAYLSDFLRDYPEGTRFIVEQVIHDAKNNEYGTIDFQAVRLDGTVDIYDWKSMLVKGNEEEAKDFKKEGIYIQLEAYARILREEYGVEKIGKLRAIPIQKRYRMDKTKSEMVLSDIDMGNANPAKIDIKDAWLRPIISPLESTGSEEKDKLVRKLEGLYKQYFEKGYFQDNKALIDDLKDAIFQIRVTNSVENLANYFKDVESKIRQMRVDLPKVDINNQQDVDEALALTAFYRDIVKNVVAPSVALQEDPSIETKSRSKLYENANGTNFQMIQLEEANKKLINRSAERDQIFGLLVPEKVVNLASRYFRSLGSQNVATLRYMYELTKKAYNRIDFAINNDLKKLKDLKYAFDQWAKANKLSDKEAIEKLVDVENGKLHSKIDAKFYEARDAILKLKSNKDTLKFVKDNYDMTAYEAWYKDTLAKNQQIWKDATYDVDPEVDKKIKARNLRKFEQNYNIHKHPITAYGEHNRLIWGRNIKENLWQSEAYKELTKVGNEPLLAVYEYMIEKNQQLVDTGSIKDYQKYNFFPNVRKDFATILMEGDKNILQKGGTVLLDGLKDIRHAVSVEGYELNYQGAIDPLTGEKLNKRFVPYVQNIKPGEKSYDIFNIYGLMAKEIYKEQYLSENDEMIRALAHFEKGKKTLKQNRYGRLAKTPDGKPIEDEQAGKNARIAEEYMNALANGQSLQYDADGVIQFKVRETWNKLPTGKLYKFDTDTAKGYNPTSISATKFLMWMNTANQKRILGVNAASAISNLFGGSFASSRLYQKYITRADLHKSWTKMTSGAFYQTEGMKKNAALVDYFLPLLNNREGFKASQLSVNEASKILSQEWLMTPMRKTSEIVQLNLFLAVMENTGIINGKLVNIRDHLAQEMDYSGRYSLSEERRKTLEKEYEAKVKEYKALYNLEKTAQFKTIEEGGKKKVVIDIPGFPQESKEVANIREIVQTMSKDALGEADEFDIAPYKFSIWWRLFMTFKNWIPRQADVRVGEFRYDQAHHAYEYGRFRMFARSISAGYVQSIAKLLPIPFVAGKLSNAVFGKEYLIKRAKEIYLEKRKEEETMGRYNPETFISEGEFIDKFIQGTESTFAEIRTMTLMILLLFTGMAASDDDDDSETKAYKALMRRQINKLQDEVGFFYSPKSFIDIGGGGLPVFSFIRDTWAFGSDVSSQFFGYTLEETGIWEEKGQDLQEKAKPIKRTFKMIPALKEILTYLPAVDEETAKEWGVKINDRRAF